jgi:hypothetical protein
MSREAAAVGISRTVTDGAFAGLTQDGTTSHGPPILYDRKPTEQDRIAQRGTTTKVGTSASPIDFSIESGGSC